MATRNITVSIPADLFDRLEIYRPDINVSALVTSALTAELNTRDAAARLKGEQAGRLLVQDGCTEVTPDIFRLLFNESQGRPAFVEAAIATITGVEV